MKIIRKGSFVDFYRPVYMQQDQREAFQKFLKELLEEEYEEEKVVEPKRFINSGQKSKSRDWTASDYAVLFSGLPEHELAKRLDRSEMAVRMKMGEDVSLICSWALKKGFKGKISEEVIKEYLESHETSSR